MFGWKGWQDRVAADPQFVYKVMIEQIIGVSASVIGDMASRPNWGLNELDFVFATLVVSGGWVLGPGCEASAGVAVAAARFVAQQSRREHPPTQQRGFSRLAVASCPSPAQG